jgi:hypothetical protein
MRRLKLFIVASILFSGCNKELRQDGMKSRLSYTEAGSTYFRSDSNSLVLRINESLEKISPENIWLVAEFSSGFIRGLPLTVINLRADRASFDFSTLLNDTANWYKLGQRRITTLTHNPLRRKKARVSLSDERFILLSLHTYERKSWTQDRPVRIYLGESAYKLTETPQIAVKIRSYRGAEGVRIKCEVHNKNLDGLHFYTDPGLPRITLYARGEGKSGIHTLRFLPAFFEGMRGLTLNPGASETVLDVAVAELMREDNRWEWYRGNIRTRPDQVKKPRRVNAFYFWFSAASAGSAYYSPELRVENEL